MPRPAAAAATLRPTLPTPTIPSVVPRKEEDFVHAMWRSAAATYSLTESALHPGALAKAMLRSARSSRSTWSVPIEAEPTKRSRLPSTNGAAILVSERMISASAPRTASRVIAVAGSAVTSPNGECLHYEGNVPIDDDLHGPLSWKGLYPKSKSVSVTSFPNNQTSIIRKSGY